MSLTDKQADFLEQFLGIRLANNPTDDEPLPDDPMVIWTNAREATDGAMSSLQAALKAYKDPILLRIAEYGLNGITDGNQVALSKALLEFKTASEEQRAVKAQALAAQAKTYRGFLDSDPKIALCERNPFGIAVPLRAKLGRALDAIGRIASQYA